MRIVRHTLPNGDIVQDRFNDATTAIIEPINDAPVLVLRNKAGAVIASFDSARVIKCTRTETPEQVDASLTTFKGLHVRPDGDANFYSLVDGKDWIARIQLNGEFMTARQEAIIQRIIDALKAE